MFNEYDLTSVVTLALIFASLMFVGYNYEKIDITFNNIDDYKEDYQQCIQDLENTQPICPSCKCENKGWFFPLFIGLIIGESTR